VAALARGQNNGGRLTGQEAFLYAGWTFDWVEPGDPVPPAILSRPWSVSLPAARRIQVSENRDDATDAARVPLPPTDLDMRLPLPRGQEWLVAQGVDIPDGTHCSYAAFSWDFVFARGDSAHRPVRASTPGQLVYVSDDQLTSGLNIALVDQGAGKFTNYLHIDPGSVVLSHAPQDLPPHARPWVETGQVVARVGDAEPPNRNFHLHFSVTDALDIPTFHDQMVTIPVSFVDYDVSTDQGRTWRRVARGMPQPGEWVRNPGEEPVMEAMWVHGSTVRPERIGPNVMRRVVPPWAPTSPPVDWSDLHGLPWAREAIFRGVAGAQNWFHIAIPTPVITDGVRVALLRVFVLFAADNGVVIDAVHIWDGPNRIHQLDNIHLNGDHRNAIDTTNTFALPTVPHLQWGLDIAIRVQFTVEGNISFSTAGADFEK
jgi:hypothetical protein